MPRDFTPMSERALLRTLLIYASELGARLFRNQVGSYVLAQPDCKSCQRFGRRLSSGMGVGSPDLIGWRTVTVTPEMVGTRLAVFCGVEVKREDGTPSDAQRAFLGALAQAGAVSGVVRSLGDLEALLAPMPPYVAVAGDPTEV